MSVRCPDTTERCGRSVSPVVGSILLVAIAVFLAALMFFIAGGLADDTDPAPQASIDMQPAADSPGSELVLRGGEELGNGEGRLVVDGVANPGVLQNQTLTLDDSVSVYPVDEEVTVYWHSPESDESYELASFEADPVPPSLVPDVGCGWVQNETDGGTNDVTVDRVVGCDVVTSGDVDVVSGGAVLGSIDAAQVDASNANVTGTVETGGDTDLTNTTVGGDVDAGGDVTGDTGTVVEGSVTGSSVDFDGSDVGGGIDSGGDVDLSDASVGDTIDAGGDVTIDTGTTVDGDVVGDQVDVSDSSIQGAVASPGDVYLSNTTVTGEVYLDGSFSCSASTVTGEGCGSYSPQGYGAYTRLTVPAARGSPNGDIFYPAV